MKRLRLHSPSLPILPPTVFRWDLDKTYLRSEFESLRELMRIPFEKPEDKVNVPGVVPLMRQLREVATQVGRDIRVYFISASPPQIGRAIREKLALDGIEYDGITFKNQLQHIVRGRFKNLREQVGYKLTELLKSRPTMPPAARELLFGDDWESDAIIYSLYADLVAGRVDAAALGDVLATIGVDVRLIALAKQLAAGLKPADAVHKIYINLERHTPPTNFRAFGTRLVPTFNYFQTAACLYEEGYLTLPAVAQIAAELIRDAAYTPDRLANSLADITRRGHLQKASAIAIREYLHARDLMPRRELFPQPKGWWQRLRRWWMATDRVPPTEAVAVIDYQDVVSAWRAAR